MPTLLLLGSGKKSRRWVISEGLNTGFGKLLAINDLRALGADPLCR